jgi:hypothetical protein
MVSKEDMRKDGIKSPNMADALCMLWAIAPRKKQDIIVRVIPVQNTFARR